MDSDLSDDDHVGNISHLGPAMLQAESEFVPMTYRDIDVHHNDITPSTSHIDHDMDEDTPLATLFSNATWE